jgi:ketosteroid isomerase-like protein
MTNAEVVLAVIRAVEERDRDALFELYHDDVELHDAPSLPYTYSARGKSALRSQLETAPESTWLGTWGPLQPTERERRMDPRVVATDGDEVTVLYTTRALAPDGERFASPVLVSTKCATASSLAHRCSTTTPRRSWRSSSGQGRTS